MMPPINRVDAPQLLWWTYLTGSGGGGHTHRRKFAAAAALGAALGAGIGRECHWQVADNTWSHGVHGMDMQLRQPCMDMDMHVSLDQAA